MKVGDYVRTECGIAKIKSFETKNKEVINLDKDTMLCNMDCYRNCCTINQVIKSSDRPIDLIEVGDYVNGYLIEKVYDVFETSPNKLKEAHVRYAGEDFISQLYDTEIKSIVTHEQFSQMEYKVGE